MIIQLKKSVSNEQDKQLDAAVNDFHIYNEYNVLITGSGTKELPALLEDVSDKYWVFPNDMQLASKVYQANKRTVNFGNVSIGGTTNHTVLIGGPCSVESEDQIRSSAELLVNLGLSTLRGGCYKPRTSPYSFQGLGLEGLKLLAKMREEFGLNVITEARDATHIDEIIEYTDIIQVGAKAMYDQGILRACAKTNKPVLIKRGFGLSGGNENVVLCERGIRTFETGTRFTLDLCGVAWLQEYTNLPIILDPSHAIGYAYGVPVLAKACVAMGIDGLLIETHPNPKVALSDASQQLTYPQFEQLHHDLQKVAASVGFKMV